MDLETLEDHIEDTVVILKAIANEKRLQIICALAHKERCVGELEEMVGLSQSALSQHLARLRRGELVATRRDAQTIYYSLDSKELTAIIDALCALFAKDDIL